MPDSAFAQKQTTFESLGRDYTLSERFSYRTNALEWVLTIPNVGMEFDLSKSQYNRNTIGITAKYNWNTYHKYQPSSVFNLFVLRPEYRYYYRQTETKANGKAPKTWRAQYLGAYADYAGYAVKFGNTPGYQGHTVGLGVSWGYDVPRYQYKKCAVDVELGLSVGLQLTKYDRFSHNTDGYFYVPIPEKSKNWHITPFPVVSELKVAFVLRPVSVERKYVKDDPLIKQYADAKSDISYELGLLTKQNFDDTHEDVLPESRKDRSVYIRKFYVYLKKEASAAERRALEQVKDERLRRKIHNYTENCKSTAMSRFYKELRAERMKEKRAASRFE